MFIIGIAGYFIFMPRLAGYILAHTGSLGIVGLMACWSASIAKRKSYGYWKVFILSLLLPVIAGFVGVFVIWPPGDGQSIACGGVATLLVSILFVVTIVLLPKPRHEAPA